VSPLLSIIHISILLALVPVDIFSLNDIYYNKLLLVLGYECINGSSSAFYMFNFLNVESYLFSIPRTSFGCSVCVAIVGT